MLEPGNCTDEEWLELMIDGLVRGRDGAPGGPSEEVQARFVGWSGEAAMRECFAFYRLTKRRYRGQLADARVLDFGVGWGRLIRLFAHDVPEAQLFGVDVDRDILEVCAETSVPGNLVHVEPKSPLPFADGTFDLVYAFSVFSHLSAEAAADSLAELGRVLRPGGQLTLTTQGQHFLDLCCAIRRKAEREELTGAEASINGVFDDPRAARKAFRRGRHAYAAVGGGGVLTDDFYGWAAIPRRWLRRHTRDFRIEDITDDREVNEQVVITLRRR